MRVLITNSLVLAAISLAPSVSAAPTSSVDSYESYPNSTTAGGTSSVPSMLYPYGRTIVISHHLLHTDARRDEVITVESLRDPTHSGNFFEPVADFFSTIGMSTISDLMPPTEGQKVALDKFHDALTDVVSRLPLDPPVSPPISRSPEGVRLVNPPAQFAILSVLGAPVVHLLEILSSAGIRADSTAPPTERQKQIIERLQGILEPVIKEAVSKVSNLGVVPLNHARSVEERSLQSMVSDIGHVSVLNTALAPLIGLLSSGGLLDGSPLDVGREQLLSNIKEEVAEVVQKMKQDSDIVHIAHSREEHESEHHDDHHSHDEHKHDGGPWEGDNKSRNAQKDEGKPHDAHNDDNKPHDAHKEGHKSHDAHKSDHKSPEMHAGDRHAYRPGGEGDRCREPRDGRSDDGHKWDDCRHYRDGKDGGGGSPLLGINLGLGHPHHD